MSVCLHCISLYFLFADEGSSIHHTKQQHKGKHSGLKFSSDINKKLFKKETWKVEKTITKKPNAQLASAHVDTVDVINVIDTYDRQAYADAELKYARAGTHAEAFTNETGKRIPKAGAFAEVGIGRAHAEASIFEADANGPNASAGAEVSAVGAGAIARAEIASASAKAGPVGVKVGLGVDTGASIGLSGVEMKFLGTRFSIGPKTGVSVLNSEVSCSIISLVLFADEGCDILSTEQQQKGKATPDHEIVDITDINDTYDRPGMAYTEGKFARAKKYVEGNEDKAGKRIPKTGVYAEAGVGRAPAEYSIFEAEAKGPNASGCAEASKVVPVPGYRASCSVM
ncbi:Serine/threonine-protein kinase 10 [Labeo rohita]|uniref:Serine/threonine-protein kinase 10 n=1 Tax=Labeo rohita TaxID=84645 RepID=A0ABQ8M7V1_LABRO|nr:Serine/threonine-protein kinase 10 [Labeo rohita]